MLAFTLGWLLFWVTDFSQLGRMFAALFGTYGLTGTSTFWELQVWGYTPMFALCAVASLPIAPWIKERFAAWLEQRPVGDIFHGGLLDPKSVDAAPLCAPFACPRGRAHDLVAFLCDLAYLGLLLLCILSVASSRFSPFIYFRF